MSKVKEINKGSKEIERKWVLSELPSEAELEKISAREIGRARVVQAYLQTEPVEVRIHSTAYYDGERHAELTIKSKGAMTRTEISKPLTDREFSELLELVKDEPFIKEYRKYQLPTGQVLQISKLVDEKDYNSEDIVRDRDLCTRPFNGYCYAEVEFNTIDEAVSFVFPLDGREVTAEDSFKMRNYWKITRESITD